LAVPLYAEYFDVADMRRLIDRACSLDGWLIFFTHDVTGTPSPFGWKPGQLEAVVAYATERATILPVRDVIVGFPISIRSPEGAFLSVKLWKSTAEDSSNGPAWMLYSEYTRNRCALCFSLFRFYLKFALAWNDAHHIKALHVAHADPRDGLQGPAAGGGPGRPLTLGSASNGQGWCINGKAYDAN
jgi:hypothetical protein